MTRNTWTAVVSAVAFVALTLAAALWQIPFVTWGPGRTLDLLGNGAQGQPAVQVKGAKTYQTSGQLRMTTVAVTRADSRLGLPEALFSWARPQHDVLPRAVVYPPSMTVEEVNREQVAEMDAAKSDAVVAALRQSGQKVTALPMVQSVSVSGPAHQKLLPGDLVEKVDQVAVTTPASVDTLVARHHVGDAVVFSVVRDHRRRDVTVTTVAGNQNKSEPTDGVAISTGYLYGPEVTYGIDPDVVGPSAGLVFSLAVYDRLTPGELTGGRSVAGTGTIAADGTVGAIGGIQEKISGAQAAGSSVFLVPANNCADLDGVDTTMTLVKVGTLAQAVAALDDLRAGRPAPHC